MAGLIARGYQADLISAINGAFADGHRRLCVQLETGGGKTAVAALIGESLYQQFGASVGPVMLFLVHRRELVNQTLKTLRLFVPHDHVGVIQANRPISPWAPFQVGTIQTIYRRLDALAWLNPKIIVVDECHHSIAKTWKVVIGHWGTVPRIGLTATPERGDGKGLHEEYDVLVPGPPTPTLIGYKAICATDFISPDGELADAKFRKQGGDLSKSEQGKKITDHVVADAFANFEKYLSDRKTLVFCPTQRASIDVVNRFRAMGVRAEHVDDRTADEEREAIFHRFHTGESQLLSNVEIATEGVDVPDCDGIMLLRRTVSVALFRQMIGRGKRPKPDGRNLIAVDCANNYDIHGHPDNHIDWTLEDGAVRKGGDSESVSKDRKCENCKFVYPAHRKVCPFCGHEHMTATVSFKNVKMSKKAADGEQRRDPNRRSINQQVLMTMGDENKLAELAKHTKNPAGALRAWRRVFGPKWERMKEERAHRQQGQPRAIMLGRNWERLN